MRAALWGVALRVQLYGRSLGPVFFKGAARQSASDPYLY